jgi:DNA-binding transcriptional ArsR family regulator
LNKNKTNLIFHPVRLRLLQALTNAHLTTSEIAEALPTFPKSSLYRHLKILLDENLVEVVETRPVKGTMEKVYRLVQSTNLSSDDLAGFSKEDHLHFFTTFITSLINGYSDFLEMTPQDQLFKSIFGYTDTNVYASPEEMEQFQRILKDAIRSLTENQPAENRVRQLITIVTYPIKK